LIDAQESVSANLASTRPFLETLDASTLEDVKTVVESRERRDAVVRAYTRQLVTDWVNIRARLAHGDQDGRVRAPENQYGQPRGYGEGILTIEIAVGPGRSRLERVTLNAEPRLVDTIKKGDAYAGVTLGDAPFHRSYRFRGLYSLVEVPRSPGDMPLDVSGLSPDEQRTLVRMADEHEHGRSGAMNVGLGTKATSLDAAVLAGGTDDLPLSTNVRPA
jgi:hypothetical protein